MAAAVDQMPREISPAADAASSGSDDDQPPQEPEFVVVHDIADDGHRAPRHRQPHLHPLLQQYVAACLAGRPPPQLPMFLPLLQQPNHGDNNGRGDEIGCFNRRTGKAVLFGVVMLFAVATEVLVWLLPAEHRVGGVGALRIVCPILIALIALSWKILLPHQPFNQ